MVRDFKNYDKDGLGAIDKDNLKALITGLG